VTNPEVASFAARQLNSTNPSGLAGEVSVSGTGILYITATDTNAVRAQGIANAFAEGYLNYSKQTAVTSLSRTIDVLKTQTTSLQHELNTAALSVPARLAIRGQYQSLYSQYVTAIINKALAQGNAKLLARASVPAATHGTPLIETVLFGGIAGLLLGLGGAFLREQLDDRVRTREDAETASSGLPILAESPQNRRAVRVLERDGLEPAMLTDLGECARALRTAVMFYTVRQEERRILVTSPSANEGKTLVSTLLAASYAQAGFRTILICADLRAPGPEVLLNIDTRGKPGLTDALLLPGEADRPRASRAGRVAGSDYVQQTDLPNLAFLPAGSIAPNPGELLGSRRMEDLLDELAHSYDILVLDSAPLLPVADTRTLVERVDGVLLVTSVGNSKRSIGRAMDSLRPAEVRWLGLVLNRVTTSPADSTYLDVQRRTTA
jgi:capsular exopolysaccharide synthesis family protein